MAVDTRPTTLTAIHNYNLRNQGWPTSFENSPNAGGDGGTIVQDPVTYTHSILGVYPSNADIIWAAKLTSAVRVASLNSYSPWQLEREIFGNTPAAKGHFIINAFDRNRQSVSGIDGIYDESRDKETWRPISVVFHAGRIWYLMQTGEVYFSQTLTELKNAAKCYQEADPTAEDINDLVATDGGKIDIAGIAKGLTMIPVRAELAVLADNGVWTISGTADGGFTATDQEIRQITNVGVVGRETVVNAEDVIYYWSRGGIYALIQDQVSGALQPQNISQNTIQSTYLAIPEAGKVNARAFYDEAEKKLYWFYNDGDSSSYDGTNFRFKYNKALVLDLNLQAFYKYSFETEDLPWISAMLQKKAGGFDSVTENVTDGGVQVTNSGEDVTVTTIDTTLADVKLKFLTFAETSTDTYQYTFSELNSDRMLDWYTFDSTGTNYTSFIETGHDILEDVISEKEANTVYCFFKRTEMNVTEDANNDLVFDKPSSCLMRAKWHWADSESSGRWSDQQQVYRLQRYLPVAAGAYDYGFEVIQTINQVRGKGRALSIRFESEQGKDFHLLGWSIPYTVITAA